jgi:hypothetical protein
MGIVRRQIVDGSRHEPTDRCTDDRSEDSEPRRPRSQPDQERTGDQQGEEAQAPEGLVAHVRTEARG